jgi:hypothetical protein
MRPSGRNEAPILVIMDKNLESCLFDNGDSIEKHKEQVEDNQIAIQYTRGGPINKWYFPTLVRHNNCNE